MMEEQQPLDPVLPVQRGDFLPPVLILGHRRLYLEALAEYLVKELGASVRFLPLPLPDLGSMPAEVNLVIIDPCRDVGLVRDSAVKMQEAYPQARVLVLGTGPFVAEKRSASSGLLDFVGPSRPLASLVDDLSTGGSRGRSRVRSRNPDSRYGGTLWMLTDREISVIRLVVGGQSAEEIAETLAISRHTVRTHVQNSMAKLGVRSRTQLVSEAVRAGIRAPQMERLR